MIGMLQRIFFKKVDAMQYCDTPRHMENTAENTDLFWMNMFALCFTLFIDSIRHLALSGPTNIIIIIHNTQHYI